MATVSEVTMLPAELKETIDRGHDIEKKQAYLESNGRDSVDAGQVDESSKSIAVL